MSDEYSEPKVTIDLKEYSELLVLKSRPIELLEENTMYKEAIAVFFNAWRYSYTNANPLNTLAERGISVIINGSGPMMARELCGNDITVCLIK